MAEKRTFLGHLRLHERGGERGGTWRRDVRYVPLGPMRAPPTPSGHRASPLGDPLPRAPTALASPLRDRRAPAEQRRRNRRGLDRASSPAGPPSPPAVANICSPTP